MKKSTRNLTLIFCSIIVLGAIGWSVLIIWFKNLASSSDEVIAQGQLFGSSTTENGCLKKATVVEKSCTGLSCQINNAIFLQSCLNESEKTSTFCEGVPFRSNIAASITWQFSMCDELGLSGNGCNNICRSMQQYCDRTMKRGRRE